MKLKTLKDLKEDVPLSQIEDVDSFVIKKEAIKRINVDIFKHGDGVGREMNLSMMEFLNITEEDLK